MSLRTRLLILVIAAMLVPAILVGLRFVQNRTSEINAALANLSATANDISGDLDEKIQGTAQLHYGLARARDLDTRDKAACSAFLSAVREEYPQFTGILTINPDGSLFCDSLRTNRTLDLRDRTYFKQALVANGRRHARAGVRPADGDIGAADRLPGALGIRRAEIHPARLVQSEEVRRVSRQAPVERQRDPARRQEGHGPGRARRKGLDRAGRRIDRELGAVPLCGRTERRAVSAR